MQITVYVGEKPVFLSGKMNDELRKLSESKNVLTFETETPDVSMLIKSISQKKNTAAIITGKNFATVKKNFFKHFILIEAAGGIVQNEKKEILFIFRKGKWDLPKGKMEKGETPETCAEREIEEETGVNKLLFKTNIGDTYHVYSENGKDILKISRWYYFTCSTPQNLRPQPEEDITEVKWIETLNIKEPMDNTYKTIREIMATFFDTP